MAEKTKKKSGEAGGNPNVPAGAYGGAKDAASSEFERLFPDLSGLFEGPSFSNYNIGGYGQGGRAEAVGGGEDGGDQRRKLELIANLWREGLAAKQAAPRQNLQALAEYEDPVGFAQRRREAALADPFGQGGYFEGRRAADIMTPEEIMASQGRTAGNQWASMRQPLTPEQKQNLQGPGGVKVAAQRGAGEFDPEELKRLNAQYVANRTYS
jgi:hypothetical protein